MKTNGMDGQMSIFDLDTCFGKMCVEHSQATKEKTLESSLKKQPKSQTKMPQFLDLRTGSGKPADASWQTDGALLGEYSMHSFGESPKEDVESLLSQILEDNPHPKYFLSAKACQGILNRANRRGKKLPQMLQEALEYMIKTPPAKYSEDYGSVGVDMYNQDLTGDKSATVGVNFGLSTGRNGVVVYDARGNGDGKTVCTITGDHCNRVTDYTPIVACSDGDVAGTLDASYYKGTGTRMGREGTYIAYCIGNGQANDATQIEKEVCKTLNCMVDPMKIMCYWDGTQTAGTLTANNAGGQQRMPDKENFNCVIKAVDCRNGTESEINNSLQANSAHSLNGNNVVRCRYIVRRLTPLECERLQGYPDRWTDIGEWTDTNGKKHKIADAPRYKALGNSIALPSWKWVLKRLCACYERDATMASLFDGIGGFPLIWEQLNGKGTCLWASEIEEFPIAVTKKRIGGD